jgi:hypothetical protein
LLAITLLIKKLGMVVYTWDPRTQKAKAGGLSQPGLLSETLSQKKKKKKDWGYSSMAEL